MSDAAILDPDALLRDFRRGVEPDGGFGHAQHLFVAWHYLRNHALGTAFEEFTRDLIAFATAQGAPQKYHATMTWALMVIMHERLDEMAAGHDWQQFCEAHPDLLRWNSGILDRYYSPEVLQSEKARRIFVLPDRAPCLRAKARVSFKVVPVREGPS